MKIILIGFVALLLYGGYLITRSVDAATTKRNAAIEQLLDAK